MKDSEGTEETAEFVLSTDRFTSDQPESLSFTELTVIKVVEKTSKKWWKGQVGDAEGFFPVAFTKPYSGRESLLSVEESVKQVIKAIDEALLRECHRFEEANAKILSSLSGSGKHSLETTLVKSFKFKKQLQKLLSSSVSDCVDFLKDIQSKKVIVPFRSSVIGPLSADIDRVIKLAEERKDETRVQATEHKSVKRGGRKKVGMLLRRKNIQDGIPKEIKMHLDNIRKELRAKKELMSNMSNTEGNEITEYSDLDSDVFSNMGGITSGTEAPVSIPLPPPIMDEEYDENHIFFEGDEGVPPPPKARDDEELDTVVGGEVLVEGMNGVPPPPDE